jgi:hypothetical protein
MRDKSIEDNDLDAFYVVPAGSHLRRYKSFYTVRNNDDLELLVSLLNTPWMVSEITEAWFSSPTKKITEYRIKYGFLTSSQTAKILRG